MPGGAQFEPRQYVTAYCPHAAVNVSEAGSPRAGSKSRSGVDCPPGEATAWHRAECLSDGFPSRAAPPHVRVRDEARNLVKVVAQVGIGHDDVIATRCRESSQVRGAVPSPRFRDHDRTRAAREISAAVVRSRYRRRSPQRGSPPYRKRSERVRRIARCSQLRSDTGTLRRHAAPPGATRAVASSARSPHRAAWHVNLATS